MLESVLTLVAVALAVTQPIPQIVRTLRTRSVAGVSADTTWLGFAINAAWVAYGIDRGLAPVALLSLAYVAGYAVIGGLLLRGGVRRGIGTGLLAGAALAALTAAAGWTALGTVLALAVGVQYLPQVLAAWSSDDLSGLAGGTYVVGAIDGVIWGAFGLVVADAPLVLYGVVMLSVATLVLVPRRRWAARNPTSPELARHPGAAADPALPPTAHLSRPGARCPV